MSARSPSGSGPPRPLPRGPHGLGREAVIASQRDRMLGAIAELVAQRGYTDTTVADVIAAAGVSRKTFYEHFENKEDCFLAAFDTGAEALMHATTSSLEGVQGRADRLEAAYRAICETLAANPGFARTFVLLAPEAGPRARARQAAIHEQLAQMTRAIVNAGRRRRPDRPPELSENAARAVVGAIHALITHEIEARGAQRLPELVPTLVAVAAALLHADVP